MKKPAAADSKRPAAANTKRPAAAGTAASEETTRKTRGTLIAKKSLGLATVDVSIYRCGVEQLHTLFFVRYTSNTLDL